MSSWGCPHDIEGRCHKVGQRLCDPGMKGCVLAGRFVFANAEKNERLLQKQVRQEDAVTPVPTVLNPDTPEK